MANMTVRSTYALDPETAQMIKQMARTDGVSQAEVIRRSVRLAAEQHSAPRMSPADVVAHYRERAVPRNRAETLRVIESMRQSRHEDDEHRGDPASR
jgi:KaiC/GvpD/RAD55 family RecA-like ATPase